MDDDIKDISLNYVKFRYIFTEGVPHAQDTMPKISELLAVLDLDQRSYQKRVKYMTMGIETLNKLGETTNKHIHIHMYTTDTVGAMRKRLQRYFSDMKEPRKGNALYSLKEEKDVLEPDRFYRYVFKQSKSLNWALENKLLSRYQLFPPGFDYTLQSELAWDEWNRNISFHQKKKADSLKPNTKDLLFEYLDKIHDTVGKFTNETDILEFILMYYLQEEKSANQATIIGFKNTALMRYGIMTPRQMAELWSK